MTWHSYITEFRAKITSVWQLTHIIQCSDKLQPRPFCSTTKCLGWFWGPTSLIKNWYQHLQSRTLTTHLHLTSWLMSAAIPPHHHMPSIYLYLLQNWRYGVAVLWYGITRHKSVHTPTELTSPVLLDFGIACPEVYVALFVHAAVCVPPPSESSSHSSSQ